MRNNILVTFALAAALAAGPVYAGGSPVGTRGQGSKTQASATGSAQQAMAAAKRAGLRYAAKQATNLSTATPSEQEAALGAFYAGNAAFDAGQGTYYNTLNNEPKQASSYFAVAHANYQRAAEDYGLAAQSSATGATQQAMAAAKNQKKAQTPAEWAAVGGVFAGQGFDAAGQGTFVNTNQKNPKKASSYFSAARDYYNAAAKAYNSAATVAASGSP